jgi:putative oxidoreductase
VSPSSAIANFLMTLNSREFCLPQVLATCLQRLSLVVGMSHQDAGKLVAQQAGRGEMVLRELMNTQNEYSLALARIGLGAVFFAHGAQKMLGWFGGSGFSDTIGEFAKFRMPTAVALFAIFVEFFGSLSLLFGLLSRVAALAIIIEMIGAVVTVHIHNGFFMNWKGQQKGEGFEYHVIALALAFLILVQGAGAVSIDQVVSSRDSRAALSGAAVAQISQTRNFLKEELLCSASH